jgi:hypothetical protein
MTSKAIKLRFGHNQIVNIAPIESCGGVKCGHPKAFGIWRALLRFWDWRHWLRRRQLNPSNSAREASALRRRLLK